MDIIDSKPGIGTTWDQSVVEASWGKLEPILTPDQLVSRHLFGIALESGMRDTRGRPQRMTPEMLQDEIERAVSRLEFELHIDITEKRRQDKEPFDKSLYESFAFFRVKHRPVTNIFAVDVVPSNNVSIYNIPLDWVETGMLSQGQLNVIPLNIAIQNGGFIPSESAGGAIFLSILAQKVYIPAFWIIDYSSGFPTNMMPRLLNEIIGVDTAIEVLTKLGATYARSTGHSVGVDGISQSVSGPGPQIFVQRITDLQLRKKGLVKQIKTQCGMNMIIGEI